MHNIISISLTPLMNVDALQKNIVKSLWVSFGVDLEVTTDALLPVLSWTFPILSHYKFFSQ